MSRITDIAKTMKTWWNEDDDPFVHRALDEIIRIDQEQAPTIEPKRGEWVDNGDRYFRCSLCGTKDTDKWRWCHGCGAKMKGADDEQIHRCRCVKRENRQHGIS